MRGVAAGGAHRLAARVARLPASPVFDALAAAGERVVSLAWGMPAPDLLPTEALAACMTTPFPASALQYGDLFGNPALREILRAQLAARGVRAPVERIAILTGGCLGIELFARLLASEDDVVLHESPAFSEAIRIFGACSDRLVPVPADGDGLDPAALEEAIAGARARGTCPRLLYTVPSFQNPTGATLAAARRPRILDLALRHGITVLEDDPYHLLPFGPLPPPPLAALDDGDAVIYLDSFSKTLAPGLRVGWAVVPPWLVAPLQRLKRTADFSPTPFAQEAARRFCAAGHLDPHLARLRASYRERKDALLTAVRRHLPRAAVRVDPAGGFFLWLDLPPSLDTEGLLPRALAAGVSYVPGPLFDPAARHSLRLSYSYEPPARLEEGVRILSRVMSNE